MADTLKVVIKGCNLQALRAALKQGSVRDLQVFDAKKWEDPSGNEDVIQGFQLDEALGAAGNA